MVPIANAFAVAEAWVFNNRNRPVPRPHSFAFGIPSSDEFPTGDHVSTLFVQDGECEAAAIRWQHPDPQGRIWRTDVVLSQPRSERGGSTRLAVSLSVANQEQAISPIWAPSSRPRVVVDMIEAFGARENFPIKKTFVNINPGEEEEFVSFALNHDRSLPIVFVSRTNSESTCLCDPALVADKLAGLCYVCVATSPLVSRNLAQFFDNRLNTYDGAVRVYWPRMTLNDSPFRHRLWTAHRLEWLRANGRRIDDELLPLLSAMSTTRYVEGVVRWEDLERMRAVQALREYRDGKQRAQDDYQLLTLADEEIARLTKELKTTQQHLNDEARLRQEAEDKAEQWKQMYVASLRHSSEAPISDQQSAELEDAKAAIDAARVDFKQQLEFLDSRIQREALAFEEPELLYAALKWLATNYLDSKRGRRSIPDLDADCRTACRFFYRISQSEITMGQYWADYHVQYHGRLIALKEHIGFGTSTEPRYSIRIAFFFDRNRSRVVIGYIGQHQRTRASN